jgi:hypothetical protein
MHTVFSVFNWLVANNLWRDVIQLSVASIFGFFLARIPWKRQQKVQAQSQAELMDKLDAKTPGGLGEIATLLQGLPQAEADITEESDS